jgi:hypothetical protein
MNSKEPLILKSADSYNADLPSISEKIDSEDEEERTLMDEDTRMRSRSVREVRKILRTFEKGMGAGEKGEGRIL